MKRPKDMTDAEREALPIGPMRRDERGRPIIEPGRAMSMQRDDIVMWADAAGETWTFGQWRDGTWYRQPV